MYIIFYILLFVFGLAMGSFLNSWVWRTQENIKLKGRSMCIHCHKKIAWYENIPLLSYIFLCGKCNLCKHKIPYHYFLAELVTGLAFVFVAYFHTNHSSLDASHFFRDVIFLMVLIAIFIYDALYKQILVMLVWTGVVFGFVMNYFFIGLSWQSMLLGAVIAGGFFLLQYILSSGRWIGGGDVRLGVLMGVWLGWQGALVALFLSYIIGAIFSMTLLLLGTKKMKSEIPFGTFLSIGTFIALYYGKEIINWYINLI